MTCKTCGDHRTVHYAESTCQPAHEGPCPSCVGVTIATATVSAVSGSAEGLREAGLTAAAKFFAAAIEHMQEGYDWDGCDLQEECKKLGLTKERLYDPTTDDGMDASDGDMVWVPTDAGQEVLKVARAALTEGQQS